VRRSREPAPDIVANYLELDPDGPSGLKWRGRKLHGKPAGSKRDDSYWRVDLMGRHFYAHRLVWILHTGQSIPDGVDIDHRDRDRSNNRVTNLRETTFSQNQSNRAPYGKTGKKDIHFMPEINKAKPYRALAKIACAVKSKRFASLDEAVAWQQSMGVMVNA